MTATERIFSRRAEQSIITLNNKPIGFSRGRFIGAVPFFILKDRL